MDLTTEEITKLWCYLLALNVLLVPVNYWLKLEWQKARDLAMQYEAKADALMDKASKFLTKEAVIEDRTKRAGL